MTQMIPTYHLPPNFSIPPDGPFQLGTVIRDFDHPAKMRPLNHSRKSRIEIPSENIYTDHKGGFEATRARLKSGELGIWAKFVGIDGVGAEAKISAERTENDVYKFESVETAFFYPSPEYFSKSMELPDVKDYLTATRFKKPVFLVTGLKVAKGVSVQHNRTAKVTAVGSIGINNLDAVPIQAGPGASVRTESSPGFSFSSSSDIVVGIQCYKVYHKTGWMSGVRRVREDIHDAGAVLLDSDTGVDNPDVDNYILVKEDDWKDSNTGPLLDMVTDGIEPWAVPRSSGIAMV